MKKTVLLIILTTIVVFTANAQVVDIPIGQIITSKKGATSLDLSNQPTGVYLITFTDENGLFLQRSKIVKE